MEELIGPEVEVILTLKEVTDLSFVTTPVFVMATLLENQMETDIHDPDTIIKFNTDLVWETNKSNIKRMRNNNIPIKLNLFKYLNENQREKFGYVVLNLRTAQYVPRGKPVKITEDYVKVLGLGKEAKGCSPHLLMSLRIQDKVYDKPGVTNLVNPTFNEPCIDKLAVPKPKPNKDETADIQDIQEIKYEGGDSKASVVEEEVLSWKLSGGTSPPRSPRTKHSITSNVNERRASLSNYEKRNSSGDLQPQKKYIQAYHNYKLEILLKNIVWYKVPPKFNFRFHHSSVSNTFGYYDARVKFLKEGHILPTLKAAYILSGGESDLDSLEFIYGIKTIRILHCFSENSFHKYCTLPWKVHYINKFFESKLDFIPLRMTLCGKEGEEQKVISTAHPEITIEKANEDVELCDIKSTFVFVETPSEFFKLLSTVPPIVSISCTVQNRPSILARAILETNKLICNGDETCHRIEFVEVKSHEALGHLSYVARLTDCGPQVMKDVTLKLKPSTSVEEADLPPVFFDNVTDKIVDELEEWKERQKDIFQQKFASKLKAEIQELRNEWMERKRELEEKLNEKMEQCRELGQSLMTATEDVKQKNREFVEKEKTLEATKSELELRYFKLLTEKNEETDKLRIEFNATLKDYEERTSRLQEEKNELEIRVKRLTTENEQMREALRTNETELEKTRRACLSQEQTATLLQDLKTMQEKLETANNSKLFFKEQWGRAVREIHRIKSEYTKNIQVQLQYRKDELKKLGLEQLFLNEKNKNNLERDDILEAKDFLGSDFDVKSNISELDFPYKSKSNYESFKTNMDIVRESNSYLLKNNQEHEERLKKLIEERDKLLGNGVCQIDDERVVKLNKEIRHLLEH